MERARPLPRRRGRLGGELVLVGLATAALLAWSLRTSAIESLSERELDALRELCRRVGWSVGGDAAAGASRAVQLQSSSAAWLGRFVPLDPGRPELLLRLPQAIAAALLAPLTWWTARGRLGMAGALVATTLVVATSAAMGWMRVASPAPLLAVIVGAATVASAVLRDGRIPAGALGVAAGVAVIVCLVSDGGWSLSAGWLAVRDGVTTLGAVTPRLSIVTVLAVVVAWRRVELAETWIPRRDRVLGASIGVGMTVLAAMPVRDRWSVAVVLMPLWVTWGVTATATAVRAVFGRSRAARFLGASAALIAGLLDARSFTPPRAVMEGAAGEPVTGASLEIERMRGPVGRIELAPGSVEQIWSVARAGRDSPGFMLVGHSVRLRKGSYVAEFHLAGDRAGALVQARDGRGGPVLGERWDSPAGGESVAIELPFRSSGMRGLDFRIEWDGAGWLGVDRVEVREATAPEAAANGLRVACVGDSITAGSGYPAVLDRLLERRLGRAVEVRNAGRSGHNTRMFLGLPTSELLGGLREPDFVLLELGTVDARGDDRHVSTVEFERNLLELVGRLRTHTGPSGEPPVVLLATLPPIRTTDAPFDPGSDARVERELDPAIRRVAAAIGSAALETRSLYAGTGAQPDGVHPTLAVAERLAEAWVDRLAAELGARQGPDGGSSRGDGDGSGVSPAPSS